MSGAKTVELPRSPSSTPCASVKVVMLPAIAASTKPAPTHAAPISSGTSSGGSSNPVLKYTDSPAIE